MSTPTRLAGVVVAGLAAVLVWLWHDAARRVEAGLCPYQECADHHRVPFERAFDDDGWWR